MPESPTLYDVIRSRYANSEKFIVSLKERMQREKITQGMIARRSGYHKMQVSHWLNLKSKYSVKPDLWSMLTLDETFEKLIEERAS
jgi:plasmid maintenance system antidote protein VapI